MRTGPDRGLPFLPLNLARAKQIGATDSAPFPSDPFEVLGGESAPPLKQPEDGLRCIETDEDQYTTTGWDACWRVLFSNPPKGDTAKRARVSKIREISLLGQKGHIERMNAWTHLVGALLFLGFSILRPFVGFDSTSLSGRLAAYSSAVVVITFSVSTAFHTGGTVRWLAPILRVFDHGAIDVALAVACTTDISIVTLDLNDVPWQTVVDPIGVAVVILTFFLYRRVVLPPEDTEIAWGNCVLGLFRIQHADFEYGALRSSGYICLSFGFVALIPAAIRNLSASSASTLIVCNGVSLILLIVGLLLDNVLIVPDVWYMDPKNRKGKNPTIVCHNTKCGCIMTSHAWWHVFSLFSVLICTIGREIAIADTDFHASVHSEL